MVIQRFRLHVLSSHASGASPPETASPMLSLVPALAIWATLPPSWAIQNRAGRTVQTTTSCSASGGAMAVGHVVGPNETPNLGGQPTSG